MRSRNLDILLAALVAILGGLAAAKSMPGDITIPLGVGLFLAPGYLWTEALLSQRLPGHERAMFAVGMALVIPVIGGFLLNALKLPLFKKDWVGVLVVFALLGVVAALIQRLRNVPEDQEPEEDPRQRQRRQQQRPSTGSVVMNTFVYGVAGIIGLAAIGYSVKSAEDQPFPAQTEFWFAPVINNQLALDMAMLSDNPVAQSNAAQQQDSDIAAATQANIRVMNTENTTETYKVELIVNGKVDAKYTKTFTLANNQVETYDVPYKPADGGNGGPQTDLYSEIAQLYMLPNTTTPIDYGNNGGCVASIKSALLTSEESCPTKTVFPSGSATATPTPTPLPTTTAAG